MIEFIHIAQAAEVATEAEKQTGVLGTLGVNWKLFLAQAFNFGVILFVLWKYVFTPVGKKLTERSEKIAIALKDAEDIELQKADFDLWKKEETTKAKQEFADILENAQKEAEKEKHEILAKTKVEQDKLIAKSKAQIAQDEKNMLTKVKSSVADMVVLATEKVLREKLDGKHDLELIKKTVAEISQNK